MEYVTIDLKYTNNGEATEPGCYQRQIELSNSFLPQNASALQRFFYHPATKYGGAVTVGCGVISGTACYFGGVGLQIAIPLFLGLTIPGGVLAFGYKAWDD